MMSFTGFSQHLKPKIYNLETDTLFCFDTDQAKRIATQLALKKHQNLVLVQQNERAALQHYLIKKQDSTIQMLQLQARNYQQIIANNNRLNQSFHLRINTLESRVKKLKREKVLLGTGLGIGIGVIGVLILNN